MTKEESRRKLEAIAKINKAKLEANPTRAEIRFRAMLNHLKVKFVFQFIIYSRSSFFVADFLVTNKEGKKYVIELDGGYHFTHLQKRSDENRSSIIRQSGRYGVIRFTNDDIFKNHKKVYRKLKTYKIV